MKRILPAILILGLALSLFACGEKIAFNAAAELPEGAETLVITQAGRSGGAYYAVVEAGGQRYTFKLADDFSAAAFEPGADGAIYTIDYYSPADFYTQWYLPAKRRDTLGTVFAFAFAGDELDSLTDTTGFSPPDGQASIGN